MRNWNAPCMSAKDRLVSRRRPSLPASFRCGPQRSNALWLGSRDTVRHLTKPIRRSSDLPALLRSSRAFSSPLNSPHLSENLRDLCHVLLGKEVPRARARARARKDRHCAVMASADPAPAFFPRLPHGPSECRALDPAVRLRRGSDKVGKASSLPLSLPRKTDYPSS